MTKTFHIGEYCAYGTIKVSTKDNQVLIQLLDYKTNNVRVNMNMPLSNKWTVLHFLENFTTPYYADKIINTIYKKQ
jgi:hypothetical protein